MDVRPGASSAVDGLDDARTAAGLGPTGLGQDDHVGAHDAVGHDDLLPLGVAQLGVAQGQVGDGAGGEALGRGELHLIPHVERPVHHQREARHQVGQGALGGDADDHAHHAHSRQQRGAQLMQGRDQAGVDDEGQQVDQEP